VTTSDISVERHEGQHRGCAACFRIKCATIQFQGIDAGQHRFTEKERDKDMRAYKELRNSGLQPKNVFGSAEIAAQANSQFEVEHSVVMAPSIRKEMESRMADAKEMLGV
jgi:hypothetical protein